MACYDSSYIAGGDLGEAANVLEEWLIFASEDGDDELDRRFFGSDDVDED